MKKKIGAIVLAVSLVLTAFVACDTGGVQDSSGNGNDQSNEKTMDMVAHYDYGLHMENKLTMLLDGCNFFFKPADYGISKLIAGDVVTITYKGECYIQETYPGSVVTKDMTIIDITVQEAQILEVNVRSGSDGYDVFYGSYGVACDTGYVINEDGTFEELGAKHENMTLYGSDPAATSSIQIKALYSYNPRPDKPIVGDHMCMHVCLEEVEPTCLQEGKSVIGCTFCGDVYETTVLPKVDCQLGKNGKCIWCEPQLSNIYTWINDLTADDILSMKRDKVTYGVAPGVRVDSRETTRAQEDKEVIISYLKNLSLKAVSVEEGAVDGGGGVHLNIDTAAGIYGIRINNGYMLIGGVYYKASESIPMFGENAVIWEACCFCGSYDCTGHEE